MIGRLVEQQNVGRGRQHPRQRRAARLAAGEMRRVLFTGQAELLQQVARGVAVVGRPEAAFDIGERGPRVAEIRLLRQVAHGGAGLDEARAAILLDQPRRDLQQRRFAGTVAADQADALAGRQAQLCRRQQRRAAERQRDLLQLDQRRRHGQPCSARCLRRIA